jgi:glutamyl-tRNA synthetase
VIRAEEWISSTPKHVLLYNAFGWELPKFWHMPLLRNVDKSKISKRKNPVSLNYYRESGFLPQAMLNFLGLMGGGMAQMTEQEIVSSGASTKESDIFSLAQMLEKYDFNRISLGGPVFDLVKLKWLNGEYLRKLSPDEFLAALRENVFSDSHLRAIVPLVQTRIDTLGGIGDMVDFLFRDVVTPPEPVWLPKKRTAEETLAFGAELLTALEASAWEAHAIEAEMKKLGEAQGWSVKENFMLLRAIITGSTQSPPLMESLVVFGKARSLDRVRRFLETQKRLLNQPPGRK